MRVARLGVLALAGVMAFSCEGGGFLPGPSWTGVYSVRADTVKYCTEVTGPTSRTCNCTAPGHIEGTLTLSAEADLTPTGTFRYRPCPPDAPCGIEVMAPVIKYQSFPPRTNSMDTVHFCVGLCYGFTPDNGGIDFSQAAINGNQLRGIFRRADGNVRGCGSDYGPFTATRQ